MTAFVTAVAAAAGRDAHGCVLVAAAVLTGQLSVGWCNDAVDADRDRGLGRSGKPVVAGSVTARAVRAASFAALALCVPLSLASGLLAGAVHLLGVAAGWAYDLGLKATLASWLPYAVGFGALPAFAFLGRPGTPPPWWAVVAGVLLGLGAHAANVLPDIDGDLATGVLGLPQRLGERRARALTPVPLVGATAVLVLGPSAAVSLPGVVVLALAAAASLAGVWVGRRRPRAPFVLAIGVAGADVALLVWRTATRH